MSIFKSWSSTMCCCGASSEAMVVTGIESAMIKDGILSDEVLAGVDVNGNKMPNCEAATTGTTPTSAATSPTNTVESSISSPSSSSSPSPTSKTTTTRTTMNKNKSPKNSPNRLRNSPNRFHLRNKKQSSNDSRSSQSSGSPARSTSTRSTSSTNNSRSSTTLSSKSSSKKTNSPNRRSNTPTNSPNKPSTTTTPEQKLNYLPQGFSLNTFISNKDKFDSQLQQHHRPRAGSCTGSVSSMSSGEIQILPPSPLIPTKSKESLFPTCQNQFVTKLHKTRGHCQVCIYHLSESERIAFDKNGRHLRVKVAYGGCKDCKIFQSEDVDDEPVRLCCQCFFNTHKLHKRGEKAFGGGLLLGGTFK